VAARRRCDRKPPPESRVRCRAHGHPDRPVLSLVRVVPVVISDFAWIEGHARWESLKERSSVAALGDGLAGRPVETGADAFIGPRPGRLGRFRADTPRTLSVAVHRPERRCVRCPALRSTGQHARPSGRSFLSQANSPRAAAPVRRCLRPPTVLTWGLRWSPVRSTPLNYFHRLGRRPPALPSLDSGGAPIRRCP